MLSLFRVSYIGANNKKTEKEICVNFGIRLPLGSGNEESTQEISII